MPDNVVGTAYVRIRALTQGIRRDIRRGFDQGVKQSQGDVDKAGRRVGQRFGDQVGEGFTRSGWARIVSRSIRNSSREANRELDRAHTEALRLDAKFERDRAKLISRSIQNTVRERIAAINRAHTEAIRLDRQFERDRTRVAELGAQAREKARRDREVAEIKSSIRIAKSYENGVKRVNNAVRRMTRSTTSLLGEVEESIKESLEDGTRRAFLAAGQRGGDIGRRFGRRLGQEVALEIRRLPILAFFLAAILPVIGGIAKTIAAAVGQLIALVQPLGPAIAASLTVGAQGFTALAQGAGAVFALLKTEGPQLDEFNERLELTKDRFRGVGQGIQSIALDPLIESIERATNAVIPRFRVEMLQTGRVLADVATDLATLTEDPFFQARFGTILASNNRILTSLGQAARSLADTFITLLAAASPLTEQFASYLANVTRGWAETLRLSQATGDLADWFRRSGEFLQQLGRIGENVRRALSETFSLANRDARRLWDGIEGLTQRWRDFSESVRGQNAILDFFQASREIMDEVGLLFRDAFRLLAEGLRTNSDSLVSFIRTIRVRVLPAIAEMSGAFANLGPVFNELVATTADFFATLANTGVITVFLTTLTTAFSAIQDLLDLPVVGTVAGWALAFLAFGRALNIVTLGAFTRGLQAAVGRLTAFGTALAIVGRQAVVAAGGAGLGALRGSAGLLAGTLGGPVGLAITGVTVALGFMLSSHLSAKQAAEQHEAELLSLAGTIDQATGAITNNTREQIAAQAESQGLLDVIRDLGVQERVLIDAASGSAGAQRELNDALEAGTVSEATRLFAEFTTGVGATGQALSEASRVTQEELVTAMRAGGDELEAFLTNALATGQITPQVADEIRNVAAEHGALAGFVSEVNGVLDEEAQRLRDVAAAAGATSLDVRTLSESIEVLGDEFSSADEKARALDDALNVLAGGERDVDEANRRLHQSFRDVEDSLVDTAASADAGKTVYLDLATAIDDSTGKLDQTTEVGAIVADTYDRLFDNANAAAIAIAESGGSADAVRQPFADMESEMRGLLETAGATPPQIDAIINSLQGVPIETVVDLIMNSDQFDDSVAGAEQHLAELNGAKAIASLVGNDIDLANKIIKNRDDLDAIDRIVATATADLDDEQAQAVYNNVIAALADLNAQNPTPTADLDPRVLDAELVRIDENLRILDAQRPTPEVQAIIEEFERRRRQVEQQIRDLNAAQASPTVTLDDRATDPIIGIARRLNNLPTFKRVSVQVDVSSTGVSGTVGNLLRGSGLARGGIVGAKGRMIAAANGMVAQQRQAAVAQGGSNILWAEPETGSESYIPWAQSKRPRATRVLDRTAREFGYRLSPMAEGGVLTRAQTLVSPIEGGGTTSRPSARPASSGIHVENLNVRAFSDEFRLKQLEDELAMHGAA